ncbi:unnamed protein product [Withania somnifera]
MMVPGMFYGGASNFDGVFTQRDMYSSTAKEHLASLFAPACSSFLGSSSMVSFRSVNGGKRSFFDSFDQEDNEVDELGEYFHQAEKKRRLTDNQVQFLEKSFGEENKLEPERKVQLAKELGLQPRQIAIWFQNRRARWKTKQLEKDYDELRNRYDTLKSNYNNLLKEKEYLRAEVFQLTNKLLVKEKGNGQLALRDIQKHSNASTKETVADPISRAESSIVLSQVLKKRQQEDLSSSKSEFFDSKSSHYTGGGIPPSRIRLSQDDNENFSKTMLCTADPLGKSEDDDYPVTSSNLSYFGVPVEDQGFGFWSTY